MFTVLIKPGKNPNTCYKVKLIYLIWSLETVDQIEKRYYEYLEIICEYFNLSTINFLSIKYKKIISIKIYNELLSAIFRIIVNFSTFFLTTKFRFSLYIDSVVLFYCVVCL